MNIFDTVYEINAKHPHKRAMSIGLDNGGKRVYTYGQVFEKVEKYAEALVNAGVRRGTESLLLQKVVLNGLLRFLHLAKSVVLRHLLTLHLQAMI